MKLYSEHLNENYKVLEQIPEGFKITHCVLRLGVPVTRVYVLKRYELASDFYNGLQL